MSWQYCHKPVCWELFRNESVEGQNRRAAINKSNSLANETRRKPEPGLWWDAQKHVDQVVPAEFVNPSNIDTSTFRYQVFARPPPIRCPETLNDVTEEPPPIRYNVKRVAVDKPYPPASFECAGHYKQHPFRLNNGDRGRSYDCSKNNNTSQIACPAKSPFARKKMIPLPFSFKNVKPVVSRDDDKPDGKDLQNNNAKITKEYGDTKTTIEQTNGKSLIKKALTEINKPVPIHNDANNSQASCLDVSEKSNNRIKQLPPLPRLKKKAAPARAEPPEIVVGVCPDDEPENRSHNSFKMNDRGPNMPVQSSSRRSLSAVSRSSSTRVAASPNSSGGPTKFAAGTPLRPGTYTASRDRTFSNRPMSAASSDTFTSVSSRSDSSGERLNFLGNTTLNRNVNSLGFSRDDVSLGLTNNGIPKPIRSNTSLRSEATSICSSLSSKSSCRSLRKSSATRLNTAIRPPFQLVGALEMPQGSVLYDAGLTSCRSSDSRDSVKSLIRSEHGPLSPHSPVPLKEGWGRRKFIEQQTNSGRESVASLISDTNQSNTGCESLLCSNHSTEDAFAELIVPVITGNQIWLNGSDSRNIVFSLNTGNISNCQATVQAVGGNRCDTKHISDARCVNNNAFVKYDNKPGRYTLQCRPVLSCDAPDSCDNKRPQKMLCRFQGRRPNIQENKPIRLCMEEVRPARPTPNQAKEGATKPQEYECRVVPSCSSGKPMVGGDGGPLMVCEPVYPKVPEIGYGTYKIVAGRQHKMRPVPNSYANLRLPPDVEEYREFTRRCPNFQIGRYDRRDPLNEMLLPSNKPTGLLGGAKVNPFSFCRMPRRKFPPLFEPLKTTSDLSWGLPAFVTNQG